MSSKSSSEGSIDCVFEHIQRFLERIGSGFFKNREEIAKVESDDSHNVDQGEKAIHLYHANGAFMSLIFHTLATPLSIRIVLDQTGTTICSKIFDDKDIFHDWVYLKGAISFHNNMEAKNSVLAKEGLTQAEASNDHMHQLMQNAISCQHKMFPKVIQEKSMDYVFEHMQKFLKRTGSEFFRQTKDIARADYKLRYDVDEGEMLIRLYHVNEAYLSIILCYLAKPLSVRIVLQQHEMTILSMNFVDEDIFADWVWLQGALLRHCGVEAKNVVMSQ